MLKAIIFGAGGTGRDVYEQVKNKYDILGFWDNDKNKHGKTLLNLPITPPMPIITKF